MIAYAITTSSVHQNYTLRVTPDVDPARDSDVVSWIAASLCCGSAIMLSSRLLVHPAIAPGIGLFRWALGRRDRRRVEEQSLGDRRLHGGALERLGNEERRLRPRSRQQSLGER